MDRIVFLDSPWKVFPVDLLAFVIREFRIGGQLHDEYMSHVFSIVELLQKSQNSEFKED